MSKVIDAVKGMIEEVVAAHGMELVDIEYKKQYDAMALTVYIDKEGGVSLSDCEEIHNAIDEPLDEIDPTGGQPYTLNVSSPGLDRLLKTARDFARNEGKDVDVSLFAPTEGVKGKKFTAKLLGFDEAGGTVSFEYENKNLELKKECIASVKLAIVF